MCSTLFVIFRSLSDIDIPCAKHGRHSVWQTEVSHSSGGGSSFFSEHSGDQFGCQRRPRAKSIPGIQLQKSYSGVIRTESMLKRMMLTFKFMSIAVSENTELRYNDMETDRDGRQSFCREHITSTQFRGLEISVLCLGFTNPLLWRICSGRQSVFEPNGN
jgi:hypothetical protein